ncbi:MAG: putative collagen-binding domain-containing protein [Bacteroidaceae bacterium]
MQGEKLTGWWFNPSTGQSQKIGKMERAQAVSFISPTPGEVLDWVLVIDDASKKYRKP